MFRFDLHVHTAFSPCSSLGVEEILRAARGRGLDGVAITDHHTMAARHRITEGVQADGLAVVIGMEYSTPEGDFLLFGPFEDLPEGLSAGPLLAWVREAGGAAVAAHPFRRARPAATGFLRAGRCELLEVANGRNRPAENRRAAEWASAHGLAGVGGSDAHGLGELGRAFTAFEAPVRSRAELVRELRAGRCRAVGWDCDRPGGGAARPLGSHDAS